MYVINTLLFLLTPRQFHLLPFYNDIFTVPYTRYRQCLYTEIATCCKLTVSSRGELHFLP